jgi:hypothetical protein
MRKSSLLVFALLLSFIPLSNFSSAQETTMNAPVLGGSVKLSTLGVGAEAAIPLSRNFNLRGGFNLLNFDRNFHKDGVVYASQINLRSVSTHLDWFPFAGSFHISPGVLLYNGNRVKANALVPGGQTFTLNGHELRSDPSNPVHGTGSVVFRKAAPMITAGWGNLLPRSGRHFSIPFEFGVAITGAPRTALTLTGSACDLSGTLCAPVEMDPTFESDVEAERQKINKELEPLKIYPIVSVGFAFNF